MMSQTLCRFDTEKHWNSSVVAGNMGQAKTDYDCFRKRFWIFSDLKQRKNIVALTLSII